MNKKEKEKIKISSYLSFLKESIFIPVLSCLCSNPQQELEERNNQQQFGHFFFSDFFFFFFFSDSFFFSQLSDFYKKCTKNVIMIQLSFKWHYFLWLDEMESKQFQSWCENWKKSRVKSKNCGRVKKNTKSFTEIIYLWIWWVLFTYIDCSMYIWASIFDRSFFLFFQRLIRSGIISLTFQLSQGLIHSKKKKLIN